MFESGSIKENLLDDNEYIKGNEHNKVDSSSSQRLQMIVKQLKSRTSIVGYIVFVNESCRGLLFPVLWPLCQELGGSTFAQGVLVAMVSLGRACFSTRMGIIADQYRHRTALLISCSILIFGSIVWSICPIIGGNSGLGLLFIAQFLLGAGTADIGVCRSYVAERVQPDKRTNAMSRLSALQFAGFSTTPIIGGAIAALGQVISKTLSFMLPPLFLASLACSSFALVYYIFEDIPLNKEYLKQPTTNGDINNNNNNDHNNEKSTKTTTTTQIQFVSVKKDDDHTTINNDDDNSSSEVHTEIDRPPLLTRTKTTMNSETNYSNTISKKNEKLEDYLQNKTTIGNIYDYTGMTAFYESVEFRVFFGFFLVNFCNRGAMGVYETQLSRIFLDEYGFSYITLGAIISSAGIIGTLQLLNFQRLWTNHYRDTFLLFFGLGLIMIAQLFILDWTTDTSSQLWQFCITVYIIYSIGFPIGNTANLGLFSTALKYGRQGTFQGRFALSASIARIIIPITSGVLEQYVQANSSFSLVLFIISIGFVYTSLFYESILLFANRCIAKENGTPNGQIAILDNKSVRNVLILVGFLFMALGFATLLEALISI